MEIVGQYYERKGYYAITFARSLDYIVHIDRSDGDRYSTFTGLEIKRTIAIRIVANIHTVEPVYFCENGCRDDTTEFFLF